MTTFAYVDPGLGALIWQSIVAAFVGFLFYLKKSRLWIVAGFKKIFGYGSTKAAVPKTVPAEIPAAKVEANAQVR